MDDGGGRHRPSRHDREAEFLAQIVFNVVHFVLVLALK